MRIHSQERVDLLRLINVERSGRQEQLRSDPYVSESSRKVAVIGFCIALDMMCGARQANDRQGRSRLPMTCLQSLFFNDKIPKRGVCRQYYGGEEVLPRVFADQTGMLYRLQVP